MNRSEYITRIESLPNHEFESFALKVFRFQAMNNPVYGEFIGRLGIDVHDVNTLSQIPFLPVDVFKSHKVLTGSLDYEHCFTSSGTTGQNASKHYIKDLAFYRKISGSIFKKFYGKLQDYAILALLPSYLERTGSSLVYMMDDFIAHAAKPHSGFYLDQLDVLNERLNELQEEGIQTLLFGVTFALLDYAERFTHNNPALIVMETGGMKGRRKELIREEVHDRLTAAFGVERIHSEYGMTELMSQAYSKGDGIFLSPPWMRVLIRDPYDPLKIAPLNMSGGVNIIDLANIESCAFVATQDLGRLHDDGSFVLLGRFDYSDMRGCNLLIGG